MNMRRLPRYIEALVLPFFVVPLTAAACGGDGDGSLRGPVALAGSDQVVAVGEVVNLDGSSSFGPEGASLSFRWELVQRPVDSDARLATSDEPEARFTTDVVGEYVATLTVSDGRAEGQASATITASRRPFDTRLHELDAHGASRGAQFGRSVAIDGAFVLVGAPHPEDRAGAAYAHRRNEDAWESSDPITVNDAGTGNAFGLAVDIDGRYVLVGAPHADGGGAAYVFRRDGDAWAQTAKLSAPAVAAHARFGWSVALAGDRAIVGAPGDDAPLHRAGSVHVFQRSDASWDHRIALTAGDAATHDAFGRAVALDAHRLFVGAPLRDGVGEDSGAAYLFERAPDGWRESARLTASDAAARMAFGAAVALDGDVVLIGAPSGDGFGPGAAYVFRRGEGTWHEQEPFAPHDAIEGDAFGAAVAVEGDHALIGAPRAGTFDDRPGAAYIYQRHRGDWMEANVLGPERAAPGDAFGAAVALDSQHGVIGAPGDGDQDGSAQVRRE